MLGDLLIKNWRIIADEALELPQSSFIDSAHMTREQVASILLEDGPSWVSGWDGYGYSWLNWGLCIKGRFPMGNAMMPKTIAILKEVPKLQFASISLMRGGTLLKTHSHPENKGIDTFHLGLSVPKHQCFLSIDGALMEEENGTGFSFDGTLPHFAFNASNEDRFILHCEFIK